ncbi:hypothetical protein SAMN05421748_104400 [Paractinoplanes atraurantiacus]|uniref:Uncharacterized protein n=1 Tax=Paractinoplanes atraurantiacus TaxID=1036182 RepID=A0A285HHP0_9ACTN|nr:hypothetical protein SAMN05421748_104400 [Actinoplanes atraurantiacus]
MSVEFGRRTCVLRPAARVSVRPAVVGAVPLALWGIARLAPARRWSIMKVKLQVAASAAIWRQGTPHGAGDVRPARSSWCSRSGRGSPRRLGTRTRRAPYVEASRPVPYVEASRPMPRVEASRPAPYVEASRPAHFVIGAEPTAPAITGLGDFGIFAGRKETAAGTKSKIAAIAVPGCRNPGGPLVPGARACRQWQARAFDLVCGACGVADGVLWGRRTGDEGMTGAGRATGRPDGWAEGDRALGQPGGQTARRPGDQAVGAIRRRCSEGRPVLIVGVRAVRWQGRPVMRDWAATAARCGWELFRVGAAAAREEAVSLAVRDVTVGHGRRAAGGVAGLLS